MSTVDTPGIPGADAEPDGGAPAAAGQELEEASQLASRSNAEPMGVGAAAGFLDDVDPLVRGAAIGGVGAGVLSLPVVVALGTSLLPVGVAVAVGAVSGAALEALDRR